MAETKKQILLRDVPKDITDLIIKAKIIIMTNNVKRTVVGDEEAVYKVMRGFK